MGDPVYFSGAESGTVTEGNTGAADQFNGFQGADPLTPERAALAFSATNEITPRAGTYCFRAHYQHAWGYNAEGLQLKYRVEFNQPGGNALSQWTSGQVMRAGFSTFLPNDTDHQNMIQTDKLSSHLWQTPYSPSSLGVSGCNVRQGKYEISAGSKGKRFVGDVVLGVWADWVFDIKWSKESDGYIKIYLNGTLVMNEPGANMKAGVDYVYWKLGIYRSKFGVPGQDETTGPYTQLKQYYDEIRIGNETNTLAEVTPGQGNTPVEPTPGLTYRNDGALPPDVEFFPSTGIYEGNPSVDGVYNMQTTALNDDGEVTDSWTWTVEAPAVVPDTEREFYMKFPDGTFKRLGLVPPGGTTGQGLTKTSGSDYDVEWTTGAGGNYDAHVNDVSIHFADIPQEEDATGEVGVSEETYYRTPVGWQASQATSPQLTVVYEQSTEPLIARQGDMWIVTQETIN